MESLPKLLWKELEEARRAVKERKPNLASVTMASLLGSLYELGVLTQGTVGLLARHFVPRICAYLLEEGAVSPDKEPLENVKTAFERFGFRKDDYAIEAEGDEVRIEIVTKKCKICPKGVGGAEIHGTACPVPYMVAYCLSIWTKKPWKVKERVKKEGDKCKCSVAEA